MRYLIFTDIHGNLEALDALQKLIQKKRIDHYLYLGDLVGYGASPNETIERIQSLQPLSIIRGNHDKAVCGNDTLENFNPVAAAAIGWCRKVISGPNEQFLCQVGKGPVKVGETITLCHGAPFDEDYYIFGEFDAAEAFACLETRLGFFGHTHFPFLYSLEDHTVRGSFIQGNFREIKLRRNASYLINPGSVGQPRDRNPRAACAIYDSAAESVKFYRFNYDIGLAQKKIIDHQLPHGLAERLALGI
jgi:predicted phosphodiesterase